MPEKDQKSKIVEKEKKSVFNTIGRYGRDAGWLLLNKKKKKERLEYAKNLIHNKFGFIANGCACFGKSTICQPAKAPSKIWIELFSKLL